MPFRLPAALGTACGLLALCTLAVARVAVPPRPRSAAAPDTAFSAERAMAHVRAIAARPHPMGSAEHDRVRDYILARLTGLGLHPQVQTTTAIGTRYQVAGRVQNIVGWLPGAAAQRDAVLLVVHYDGVEAGPAASDDGAGVAALLETIRALRARAAPLGHDVIALFTDGEEAGLLGAAAFVREHPWARDVRVVLNFEARGTSGRAFMFETGPGNLDAARMLRAAGEATAGSIFTTVYHALPNDTDLSELSVLGTPALNFAFADGVDRYHTAHDDVQFLNPGSLQHHGDEMLALATRFANAPLPRPRTGDAVFFDLPVLGLVVYPVGWALPLAILGVLILILAAVRVARTDPRWASSAALGLAATLVATLAAALMVVALASVLAAVHAALPWGGSPRWSGIYAVAFTVVVIACVLAMRGVAARRANARAFQLGVVLVWTGISLALAVVAPATTYLFTWPALCAAIALARPSRWLEWLSAAVVLLIAAGLAYGVGPVMLGLTGVGAAAFAILVALIAALVLPLLVVITGDAPLAGARVAAIAAVVVLGVALLVVRRTAAHPEPANLVYAVDADSGGGAWLGRMGSSTWSRGVVGPTTPPPAWAPRASGGWNLPGHMVPVVLPARGTAAPSAMFVRDTVLRGARRIVLRVFAPAGATNLALRATGAPVLTSSVGGRVVDTTRYRRRTAAWSMTYWAVPDTGAIVALSVPIGAHIDLALTARQPGLPAIPGVIIPPRPDDVVPAQTGDATLSYRRFRF